MFGKNKLEKSLGALDGSTLQVVEIFYTIQGEGPSAGTPAVFIRLAGCNLACTFCDTDFETGAEELPVGHFVSRIENAWGMLHAGARRPLVVITGGEPLRQNIAPLLEELVRLRYAIEIETAGTLLPKPVEEQFRRHCELGRIRVICSPKTQLIHRGVASYCYNYKYIVGVGDGCLEDGVPCTDTQGLGKTAPLYCPAAFNLLLDRQTAVFVQPMEVYAPASWREKACGFSGMIPDHIKTLANHDYAVKIALKLGYRISVQVHKILGLR